MKTQKTPFQTASSEQVSRRAYELWQQAGYPQGRDLEFWLAAERQLQRDKRAGLTSGDSASLSEKSIAEELEDPITPTVGNSRRSATSL